MTRGHVESGRIVGRYSLDAAIAAGGMATVHLARDLERGGVVAIKRLHPHLAEDPDVVKMFLDEARLAAHVAHPNVIRALDSFHAEDEVFLVMEYVPGESLARLVRGKRPPAYRATVSIIRDALFGLHAAHCAADEHGRPLGLVHRDVSPDNILVGTDGIARLLDFGVAKAAGRGQRETRPGELKGKLAFMAPEHLRSGAATPRTDIYAMGVVLWELVTGKRMLKGESPGVIVTRILQGEVQEQMSLILAATARKLPDIALPVLERLDAVIMRAVAADPNERYASAQDMAIDLTLALDPAAPADVGAWVERTAPDVLASRAVIAAELVGETDGGETDDDARGTDSEPPTLLNDDANGLLPILVADLADAAALDAIAEAAETHAILVVPLVNAPGDARDHVLEVLVPGRDEPVLFVARPVGAPQDGGFPLALRVHGTAPAAAASGSRIESPTGRLLARTESRRVLTEGHSRDLDAEQLAPPPPDVLGRTITVQGGTVRLEQRLGAGGGGAVYRAKYTDLKRKDVAVKVQHFRPDRDLELCARFHSEALAASKLDHRNLVRVIDFGQEPDGLFHLTMEFLDGPSLRTILDEDGPLPLDRVVKVARHVCAGLAHAHRRGVVHRDVKPSNVIIVTSKDDDGRPQKLAKVCDFGIASTSTASTSSADVVGTPQYMSPEQCRGDVVDARSDIYSCGVMLYELATGKLPFEGRDASDFLRLHQLAAPTPPSTHMPDIDPLFEQILLRALEKKPEARFQSMLELRTAIKELMEPAFIADQQRISVMPMSVSMRISNVPMRPEGEEPLPLESSLEAVVVLLRSLTDMPHATDAQLADLERKTEKLEGVVRALALRGDAAALLQVIRAMDALQAEAGRASVEETWTQLAASCAQRLLHTVGDPATLVPAAEKLLSATAEPNEAWLSVIEWARVPGAYALFSARAKLDTPIARTRFVSAMRLVGAGAVPVVRAALEQLWPEGTPSPEKPALVVDLLRSVPGTRDDALGTAISRYARCGDLDIQRAALSTLVHVWGDRAAPALLAGMQSADEAVQIIAVRGLRSVAPIDELVVRKIDFMIGDGNGVSDDLRVAAAEALGYALPDARAVAARAALRFLEESAPVKVGGNNAGVIACARAALALSPGPAKKVIETRAAKAPDALRGALLALLA